MFRSPLKPILFCLAISLSLRSLALADNGSTSTKAERDVATTFHSVLASKSTTMEAPATAQVFDFDHDQTPSIIVRPSSQFQQTLNQCELKVEPLAGPGENQFRVKLSIPNSIKVVELIPESVADGNRRIRVFVEQEPGTASANATLNENSVPTIENPTLTSSIEPALFRANPFFSDPNLPPATLAQQNTHYDPLMDSNDFDPSTFQLSSSRTRADFNRFGSASYPKPEIANVYPVEASIVGPRSLPTGVVVEFEIMLNNRSNLDFSNLLVQLQLPEGLETNILDRSAWSDEARRTVSWQIASLPQGETEVIRYAVNSTMSGPQRQRVVVGAEGLVRGSGEIETIVTAPLVTSEGFQSDQH